MELQHAVDVERLKAEDVENIKFDLEIMTEVKNWQDQEMDGLKGKLKSFEEQINANETALKVQAEKVKSEMKSHFEAQLE